MGNQNISGLLPQSGESLRATRVHVLIYRAVADLALALGVLRGASEEDCWSYDIPPWTLAINGHDRPLTFRVGGNPRGVSIEIPPLYLLACWRGSPVILARPTGATLLCGSRTEGAPSEELLLAAVESELARVRVRYSF